MLYQVALPYACFGIVVEAGCVTAAAPIGRWMVGKTLNFVTNWIQQKRGKIIEAPECPTPHNP